MGTMIVSGDPSKQPRDPKHSSAESGATDLRQRLTELERALTEKQWAETALREKEARLRLVVEQMPAIIWSTDADLRYTSILGAGLAALNMRPNQAVGMSLFEYFKTNDPAFMPIAAHRLALHGESVTHEMEWMGRVLQVYVEPLRDRDGSVIGTVGAALDITQRKRAEEAVREREERLRLISEQMPAVVWTTDTDLRFTSSLGAGLAAVGLRPNQVVGMSLFEYFRTSDLEFPAIAAHRRALKGETVAYEMEWGGRALQNYVEPLRDAGGTVIGAIGIAMDVTERKRAEEEARRWAEVVQNTRVGVAVGSVDDPPRILLANPAFEEMHGYSPGELVGRPSAEIFAPGSRAELPEHIRRTHETGHHVFEALHLRKDGSVFPAELHATAVRDAEGRPLYRIVTVFDVTERKHAEEEQRRSGARFRALIENAADAVCVIDAQARILYVSSAVRRMLGYAPNEWMGIVGFDLVHPEDLPSIRGKFAGLVEGPGRSVTAECRVRHKDGSWRWVEIAATNLLAEPAVRGVVVNFRDITERKMKERLRTELKEWLG